MPEHASQHPGQAPRIAVLVPCYNEEKAVAQTVRGFRDALPGATVYVYDNASTDRTGELLDRVEGAAHGPGVLEIGFLLQALI